MTTKTTICSYVYLTCSSMPTFSLACVQDVQDAVTIATYIKLQTINYNCVTISIFKTIEFKRSRDLSLLQKIRKQEAVASYSEMTWLTNLWSLTPTFECRNETKVGIQLYKLAS